MNKFLILFSIFLLIIIAGCSQQDTDDANSASLDEEDSGDTESAGQDEADVEENIEEQMITDNVDVGEMI